MLLASGASPCIVNTHDDDRPEKNTNSVLRGYGGVIRLLSLITVIVIYIRLIQIIILYHRGGGW
jgi:hypothetical protein